MRAAAVRVVIREALEDVNLENLGRARESIGRWVDYYNENHAALDYLPPQEYYRGASEAWLA